MSERTLLLKVKSKQHNADKDIKQKNSHVSLKVKLKK